MRGAWLLGALIACGGSSASPPVAPSDPVAAADPAAETQPAPPTASVPATPAAEAPPPAEPPMREARRRVTPSSVCTPQAPDDCVLLGTHVEYGGDGFTKDVAKAAAYYTIACDAGDTGGCASLAEMYQRGKGVPQDDAEAMRLLRHACDLGDCMALAFELVDSDVRKERDEGLAIFARVCGEPDDGWGTKGRACHMRGDRARTRDEGAPWMRKACDAGNDRACEQLSSLYFNDEYPGLTPAQATRALELLCEGKRADACMHASQRHFEGLGVPASRDASWRWQQKACDAGDQQTCERLERQRRLGAPP